MNCCKTSETMHSEPKIMGKLAAVVLGITLLYETYASYAAWKSNQRIVREWAEAMSR